MLFFGSSAPNETQCLQATSLAVASTVEEGTVDCSSSSRDWDTMVEGWPPRRPDPADSTTRVWAVDMVSSFSIDEYIKIEYIEGECVIGSYGVSEPEKARCFFPRIGDEKC